MKQLMKQLLTIWRGQPSNYICVNFPSANWATVVHKKTYNIIVTAVSSSGEIYELIFFSSEATAGF